MHFDLDTANDDMKDKMYFFVFADKTRIYAWNPLRKNSTVRIIGTNFTNIVYLATDSDDSDRDFLFVADNDANNTKTTITRFYVKTNFSDDDVLDDEYYVPTIILDYSQRYVHYSGNVISGMCIHYDE